MANSKIADTPASSCKSRKSSSIGTTTTTIPIGFSELEMNAIEFLVQLSSTTTTTSGGGGSTSVESHYHHTDNDNGTQKEITSTDAKIRAAAIDEDHRDQVVSSSSFKSQKILFTEDVGDDEDEVSLGRRKKRFRSISELYELTTEPNLNKKGMVAAANANINRKRKKTTASASGHASSRSS